MGQPKESLYSILHVVQQKSPAPELLGGYFALYVSNLKRNDLLSAIPSSGDLNFLETRKAKNRKKDFVVGLRRYFSDLGNQSPAVDFGVLPKGNYDTIEGQLERIFREHPNQFDALVGDALIEGAKAYHKELSHHNQALFREYNLILKYLRAVP